MLNSQPTPVKGSSRRFTTDKQREAARRNGAKSKGPVTAAGKARSSRNNFKHGIYSKTVDLTSEEGYYTKFRNYLNDFPGESLELFELIERIVTASLRRRQLGQIHAGVWNDYLVTQPENTPLHEAYGVLMDSLLPLEAAENREFYRFHRIARILKNLKYGRPNPTSPKAKFLQYFREQNAATDA
jgi:hypothetical protein